MGINTTANSFSNLATSEFMAATGLSEKALATKAVSILSEAGADFTMSIASNYITRGELDLKGEGLQQFREVLIGIARGKVCNMKADTIETANEYISKGQLNDAITTLQDSGLFDEKYINNLMHIDVHKYSKLDFEGRQGSLLTNDFLLLYESKTKGIDINDLLVPKISSANNVMTKLNIGDVFEIDGQDTIFIKTSDGEYKNINMSKETYCRLFPAVDRFSSGQQYSGDCYLVAALNAMMTNPASREKLLSCFSENLETGEVTIKLPDSNVEISIKKEQTIEDLGVKRNQHMSGSLGMQLLEYAYKNHVTNDDIGARINKAREIFHEFLGDNLSEYTEFFEKRGITGDNLTVENCAEEIIKINEELSEYLKNSLGREIDNGDLDQLYRLYNRNASREDLGCLAAVLDVDDIDLLHKTIKEMPDSINAMQPLLWRYNHCLLEFADSVKIEQQTGRGGHSDDVLNAFGLSNSNWIARTDEGFNNSTLQAIINNPDLQDNYVIIAGTDDTNPELNSADLVGEHAYSIYFKINSQGETVVEIINPWKLDSLNDRLSGSKTISIDDFREYFNIIYIAEI